MASYIDHNERVLDLGCGKEWLIEYLHSSNEYFGVDYRQRSSNTIVCDFNKYEFIDFNVDTAFISGCMEYVNDYDWFINKSCQVAKKIILSYCCLETHSDLSLRSNLTWVNNLSKDELVNKFKYNGFDLVETFLTETENRIFIFKNNV
jgi:ubiquinone/menaquinone biosynthesis C-methylase UbiE